MKRKSLLFFVCVSAALLFCAACGLLGEKNHPPEIPGKIVFSAEDNDGSFQIFKMNADGTDLKQLTSAGEEGYEAISPSWRPDGQQIIFSSSKRSTSIGPALWVMNANGSNQRVLYDPEPDNVDVHPLPGNNPKWSPDGNKIVFDLCVNCQISTNYIIYVFDIETRELTQLTDASPGYENIQPKWSPDGGQIAFISNRDYLTADTLRYRKDLYIMNVDGSKKERLTETGYTRDPIWRAEKNSITFRNSEMSASAKLYEVNVQSKQITSIQTPFSDDFLSFPFLSFGMDSR